MPTELRQALVSPDVLKCAWNAPFEQLIIANALHMPVDYRQWRCSMVKALACSLPGDLGDSGSVVGLPQERRKSMRGRALIRLFCSPQKKPTKKRPMSIVTFADAPTEWAEFRAYNIQDVIAEQAIDDTLEPWDLPADEWELWALDREINERGLPINRALVNQAIILSQEMQARNIARLKELTSLENPNSNDQMLRWLTSRGYPFDDLRKGHVQRARDAAEVEGSPFYADEAYREVLYLRRETSRTSVKKFEALARATDTEDDRLRNSMQFCAAGRTWRWGGRMFQPQNLAKPALWIDKRSKNHPDFMAMVAREVETECLDELIGHNGKHRVMDMLSACVRPAVRARPGHVLIAVDLNAIENRVLGWLSGDDKILGVYWRKEDPYLAFGAYLYSTPYSQLYTEWKAGDSSKRNGSKPGALGCGYGLSAGVARENEATGEIEWTGLMAYAINMGSPITLKQAELSVQTFRNTYVDVVRYWYDLADAAAKTIRTGREHGAGPLYFSFDRGELPALRMHLPSGRALTYINPRLEVRQMWWGKEKEVILYDGLNDKNQWIEIQTHPGKIVENGDQAISRDILAHGLKLADREGLDIVLHVHDEIVAEVREDDADYWLKVLEQCMSDEPRWVPGLPLGVKGSVSPIYLKD